MNTVVIEAIMIRVHERPHSILEYQVLVEQFPPYPHLWGV